MKDKEYMSNLLSDINKLRKQINDLDESIVKLIAKRLEISQQIGYLKEQNEIAIYDGKREDELRQFYSKLSQVYMVDEEFIHEVFSVIIKKSRLIQMKGG